MESIYLAGRRLYIFVGGEINEFASAPAVEWGYPTVRLIVNTGIGEKMKEYARLWPGRVRSEWLPPWPYVCDPTDSDADCLVKKLPMNVNAILDHVEGYDSLYLRAGTGEGRTAIRGWAGWTRLWPETAEEQDKSDRSTGQRDTPSVSFDVSDVDTTNFPEFDCSFVNLGESCGYWERSAATGVNGIVGVWIEGNDVYVQLKKDPEDPATFEAEKATILGRKRPEDRMVIIPVKYSLQELWKWGVILDRFAKSPGNTIGITGAKLRTMIYGGTYPAEVGLYRDVGTGEWIEGGGVKEYSLIRETVGVGVLDAYQVKDALPVLLPQLGIPVDAVGVITQYKQEYEYERPASDTSSDSNRNSTSGQTESRVQNTAILDVTQPDPLDTDDLSAPLPGDQGSGFGWWIWLVVGGGAVVALVSVGVGWSRLRRRA